jgi:hypothetical protein
MERCGKTPTEDETPQCLRLPIHGHTHASILKRINECSILLIWLNKPQQKMTTEEEAGGWFSFVFEKE